MLIIPVPKTGLAALNTQNGFAVHIDGEPVDLRLVFANDEGWLCYRDRLGFAHRCKVLTATDDGDRITFYAASHGEESKPHNIFAVGDDGKPVNLLAPEADAP